MGTSLFYFQPRVDGAGKPRYATTHSTADPISDPWSILFSLLKRLFNSKHMTRTTLWCIQRGAKCQMQVKFTPDMEL